MATVENRFHPSGYIKRGHDNLEKYLLGEGVTGNPEGNLSDIALWNQRGARARNWDMQTEGLRQKLPLELKELELGNRGTSSALDVLESAMLPKQPTVNVNNTPMSALQSEGGQPKVDLESAIIKASTSGDAGEVARLQEIMTTEGGGYLKPDEVVGPGVSIKDEVKQAAIAGDRDQLQLLKEISMEDQIPGEEKYSDPFGFDQTKVAPKKVTPPTEGALRAASLILHGHKGLTSDVILSEKLLREELAKDNAIEQLKILTEERTSLSEIIAGKEVDFAKILADKEVGLGRNEVLKIVGLNDNKTVKEAAVHKSNNELTAKREELAAVEGVGGSKERIAKLTTELETKSKELIAATESLEETKRQLKESTEETIRKLEESKQKTIRAREESEQKTKRAAATDTINLKIAQDKHTKEKEAAIEKAQKVKEAKLKELSLLYSKGGSADRIAKLEAEIEAETQKVIAKQKELEETKRQFEESEQETIRSAATNEMEKALGFDKNEKWLEAQKYKADKTAEGKKKAEGKKTSNTLRTSKDSGKPIKPTDLEDTLEKELAKQSALDAPSLKVITDPGDPGNANPYGVFDFGLNDPIPATPPTEIVLPPTERRRLASAVAEAKNQGLDTNQADLAGINYLTSIGRTPVEAIWFMWKQFNWPDKKRNDYLAVTNKQTIPPVE